MLTPTVNCLGPLPSAHPAIAGAHTAAPLIAIAAERMGRPRPDRKASA